MFNCPLIGEAAARPSDSANGIPANARFDGNPVRLRKTTETGTAVEHSCDRFSVRTGGSRSL